MYYSISSEYINQITDTSFIKFNNSLIELSYNNTDISYIPFIYLGTINSPINLNYYNKCINNIDNISGNCVNIKNYYINTITKNISWHNFKKIFYFGNDIFFPNYNDISFELYCNFKHFNMVNLSNGIYPNSTKLNLYKQVINSYLNTANICDFSTKSNTILQKFFINQQTIFSSLKCQNYNLMTYSDLINSIELLADNNNELLLILNIIYYPPIYYETSNNIFIKSVLNTVTLNISYYITDFCSNLV